MTGLIGWVILGRRPAPAEKREPHQKLQIASPRLLLWIRRGNSCNCDAQKKKIKNQLQLHEPVSAGCNLNGREQVVLGIVDIDGATIGFSGPSGMAGRISRRPEEKPPVRSHRTG